jgi:hypothetical protein
MNALLFTTDFQITLLSCLLKDPKFWAAVSPSLRITDFGPHPYRFVFEIARNHFLHYGALPSVETLILLVDSAFINPPPELESFCPQEDKAILIHMLERYADYEPRESETDFYRAHLNDYLASMRWNHIIQEGLGADELIQKASDIKEELGRVNNGKFKMTHAGRPVPKEERSCGARYGLGIQAVDARLAGGLMRKQTGLLCAGTGVGKSNLQINMMAANTWRKTASLYITLELTSSRINERYQAMLAGIPASLFKVDERYWPEHYRKRHAAISGPRFKLHPYATTLDMADNDYGVIDIENAINVWKDKCTKEGLNADEDCTTVMIDWLDRVSANGLVKVNKNSSEERIYNHIMEKFSQIVNKHNLMLWTATQAKPEAKSKEVLRSTDIAWGGSKLNMVDAGIGLCPKNVDEKLKDSASGGWAENDDTAKAPECSRMLNASFLKTRDTSAVDTFVPIYQGPSLKFWNSSSDAIKIQDAIKLNPLYGLDDVLD